MLWIAGGIMALCGALSYAELAVRHPGSGGEYHYLSKIYHPTMGFLSGWISATVGFAAPIGLASMAFGGYLSKLIPEADPTVLACSLILTVAGINFLGLKVSEGFQKSATYLNIALMIILVLCGLFLPDSSHFSFSIGAADWAAVFSGPFAVSLVYVSYAYSGWNAITYIAGDVEQPDKTVPRALIGAALTVMLLYVLVNFVFLFSTPMPAIEGLENKEEIAFLAATNIFGEVGGKIISALICLALLASVHSMTITGPRVTQALGRDLPALAPFAKTTSEGAPLYAILLQTGIALALVLTATFGKVLTFIGFTLGLFTTLTVAGLLVERYVKDPQRRAQGLETLAPGSYRTPLFPLPTLIFLALEGWMLFFNLKEKPVESRYGLALVGLGLLFYWAVNRKAQLTDLSV
jgi:APA family basic amino acid/polyamine antiporter